VKTKMANCAEWEERIALHAGGDAAEGVEGHLAECPACQEFWSEMRESVEALRSLEGDVPDPAHFAAVRARVIGEIEQPRRVWRRLAWISGVAAMLLAVLLWPRERVVPDPPRMMAAIPKAPLAYARGSDHNVMLRSRARRQAVARTNRTPLTVRLQTPDPNIVIYWIAD
jgi:hypothetical protein